MMILLITFLSLLSQITCFVIAPKTTGCSIAISDLDPEPIIVNKNLEFIYPEPGQTEVNLKKNDAISISCPGRNLLIGSTSYSMVDAICSAGNQFLIDGKIINFNQIKCSKESVNTARYTGNFCQLNGLEIEIGFLRADNSFIRLITICFDPAEQNPLYSQYYLTKSIGSHEHNVPRPAFVQDRFYNVGGTVNSLYVHNNQRRTINALLGLPENSTKYIQNNNYYLARGHLTAKADFVYAPEQRATFHYVNAAPQWQTFNGVNWEQAESDVRSYAENNTLDLIVYTGTYGVATLPHEATGKDIELYLYVDGENRGIPVPALYWKVVYHQETKRGIALIGLNNPYEENFEKNIICKDVSQQINWLHWDAHNVQSGYSYVCEVNDLKKVVPQIPDMEVTSLLV